MPYTKIFETEIGYWDKELSLTGNYPEDIKKRLTPERMKEVFPECLFPLMAEFQKPRILDVGSGPVSMLNYIVQNNLAELVAADPLAEEYHKLLFKYGYSIKYPMLTSPGEELTQHIEENSFDITWIHNALDHSQNPAEVVRQMVKATRYGGYIVIVTWENEGSFESFFGLHQHNLFFKEDGLYLQTLKNKETEELTPEVNIIKDLPIKIHSSKATDVNGRKWIELILKKQCPFFHSKRTEENKNFFDSLVNSWLPVYSNPNFPLWGSYALTSNNRGNYVLNILQKYTEVKGKDYLDIGTAYGGFLMAFYRAGAASVTGIDINQDFLKLARANARDNGLSEGIFKKINITNQSEVAGLFKFFNIITLNDVLEHVDNIPLTLENLFLLTKPGGTVYLEIPNKYYPGFIIKDGHYGLFGITLLNKEQAEKYYNFYFPGSGYSVGKYLSLFHYRQLFAKAGFACEVIEETFASFYPEKTKGQIETLRADKEKLLQDVPDFLQTTLKMKLNKYLKEVTTCKEEDFKLKYGVPFWKIILRKKTEV